MVGRLTDSFSHLIKTVHLGSQNPPTRASATTCPDGAALFFDDDKVYTTFLADNVVEVEVQPVVISKAGLAAPGGKYVGLPHKMAQMSSL